MNYAHIEREALCELLRVTGPDAPTLSGEWKTYDLVAHLYVRENDPTAAPGIFVPQLENVTKQRMDAAKERFGYEGLVSQIQSGPGKYSLMSLPGVDQRMNTIEYFIHHEDVRRAQPEWTERPLPQGMEDDLWYRLNKMGKMLYRKSVMGVRLERDDIDPRVAIRVHSGEKTINISGKPSELLMFSYGRKEQSDVTISGTPEDIDVFMSTELKV